MIILKYMHFFWPLLGLFIFTGAFAFSSLEQAPRAGDFILQPLDCSSCEIIAQTEKSLYSHMGVVVTDKDGTPYVAEALGSVRIVSLENFLAKTGKNKNSVLFRNRELGQLYREGPKKFSRFTENLRLSFYESFNELPYDKAFRWDNFDPLGAEKLYCSELAVKLLNPFLSKKLFPVPMDFSPHYNYWREYFKGAIPQGELGLSPGKISRSKLFYQVRIF